MKAKKLSIEQLFIIVALTTGILFAFMNPFAQEPDGWTHFMRSLDVSYGNVFAPLTDNYGDSYLMYLPANITDIGFRVLETMCADGVAYTEHMKNLWFTEELRPIEGLGEFHSLYYLPQAIGLFLARILGLSVYGHMVMARVVNLLSYTALAYTGLRFMPRYRNIYLVVALLPMTVYQAASFSYDSMLNGLSFLFIGLCFHYAYKKETLTWKDTLWLGVILGLLFLCKYVYACMGLLVFLIPMKKFGEKKNYWIAFGLAMGILVLMMASTFINIPGWSNATDTTVAGAESELTQFGYMLEHPMAVIKAFFFTIGMYFSKYIDHVNTLGWLNYPLEPIRYIIPIFVSCVALLDTQDLRVKQEKKDKLLYICTFAITVSAGMLGLYLFDEISNPVGSPLMLGYQGRYAIPVLMLLMMLLPNKKIENKIEHFSVKVVGFMAVMLCLANVMLYVLCY